MTNFPQQANISVKIEYNLLESSHRNGMRGILLRSVNIIYYTLDVIHL